MFVRAIQQVRQITPPGRESPRVRRRGFRCGQRPGIPEERSSWAFSFLPKLLYYFWYVLRRQLWGREEESMPVNKCLLQPSHPWHDGHTTAIGPIDPRTFYEARTRRKDAGRRAWRIVERASDPNRKWWAPHIAMTDLQRSQLFLAIRDELFATTLLPIGGNRPPSITEMP